MIIQVSRMRDGSRRITYITEITGMEGDVVTMQDLSPPKWSARPPTASLRSISKITGCGRIVCRKPLFGLEKHCLKRWSRDERPDALYHHRIGAFLFVLIIGAATGDSSREMERRLARVGPQGTVRKLHTNDRLNAIRRSNDSGSPLLNHLVALLPTDSCAVAFARTAKNITLGEYLLMNALCFLVSYVIFHLLGWALHDRDGVDHAGFGVPHFITGFIGNRRIKKFLASFPEAIDYHVPRPAFGLAGDGIHCAGFFLDRHGDDQNGIRHIDALRHFPHRGFERFCQ